MLVRQSTFLPKSDGKLLGNFSPYTCQKIIDSDSPLLSWTEWTLVIQMGNMDKESRDACKKIVEFSRVELSAVTWFSISEWK